MNNKLLNNQIYKSNNLMPTNADYTKYNVNNKMQLNYKWKSKDNKLVLYKDVSSSNKGVFSFDLYNTYRDVVAVKLLKAKIFTHSTSNSHSEFFVLHINELNKNESDNLTHKLNNSFAILDIDTHMEQSSSSHHHIYTNQYDINRDAKYFDPPLHSLNKLSCQVYKKNQSNILDDVTDSTSSIEFEIRLEFLIETKEKSRRY